MSADAVRLLGIVRQVLSGREAHAAWLEYERAALVRGSPDQMLSNYGLRNTRCGDANLWAHHGDRQTGRSIHLRHVRECVLIPG